uniref:ABC transporter ATP-binding protein n=1 Tax=Elioraea sp. TaxID=2185103 RepID=UPI003F71BEA5
MTAPLLDIVDYRLAFDGFEGRAQVLDGIDLAVQPGETVGIVGETGCGKSVLARSIARLIEMPPGRVLSGTIRFDGADVLAMDETALARLRGPGVAMIFQDPMTYLNPVFSIGAQMVDVIRAHDRAAGKAMRPRAAARAVAAEVLGAVRMPEPDRLLDRYPHELSGGMRQRVLIAMALAGEPKLLVADEPTTALDVTIQAQVLRLIEELVRTRALTLLLISHDLGVIGALCRRIVVMYAGGAAVRPPAPSLHARPARGRARSVAARPARAGDPRAHPEPARPSCGLPVPSALPARDRALCRREAAPARG